MPGEILAEDDSPMIMTVGQYNKQVSHTWNLAIEAEKERIIKLLQAIAQDCDNGICNCLSAKSTIALIKGENNG